MVDIAQIGKSAAPFVDDVALFGARAAGINNGDKAAEVEKRAHLQHGANSQMMQSSSPMALQQASRSHESVVPQSIIGAPMEMAKGIHDKAASLAAQAHHETYKKLHKEEVGQESGFFKAASPVESVAHTVDGVGTAAMIGLDMAIPLAAGTAGFLGFKRASAVINKPHEYMNPQADIDAGKMTKGQKLNNGVMASMTALQAYGVAKGFTQNLNSLKHMYSDVTGIPVENVGTMTILTGKVPAVVKDARDHFLKEYVSRGAISAVGVGLVGGSILRGKMVGMKEMLIPMGAGMAVDALMGDSILPYYTGFANAYRSGKPMPPASYSEFIMSASEELKKRGKMGHRMAILLGEEYAKDQTNPSDILKELESNALAHKHGMKGKFDERIDHILDKIEHQKVQQPQGMHGQQPQGMSMVDRINGTNPAHQMEVKGKHTQRYQQELMNKGQGHAGRVTPS